MVVLGELPRAPQTVFQRPHRGRSHRQRRGSHLLLLAAMPTCCVTAVLPDSSPNEQGCGASFQVLPGLPHSFSGEVSIQVLCPFLNLLFLGVAELQFCLHVLEAKLFPDTGFVETSSPVP